MEIGNPHKGIGKLHLIGQRLPMYEQRLLKVTP